MPSTDPIAFFLAQTGTPQAGLDPVKELGVGAPAAGTVPANGPANTGSGPGGGLGGLGMLLPILVVFGVFILMQTLASKKEKKKREQLLSSIGKGDKVLTVGGQIGFVDRVMDNEVVLKIDENSNAKARFTKAAIQQVLESAGKGGAEAASEASGTIEVKTKGEKVLAAR